MNNLVDIKEKVAQFSQIFKMRFCITIKQTLEINYFLMIIYNEKGNEIK